MQSEAERCQITTVWSAGDAGVAAADNEQTNGVVPRGAAPLGSGAAATIPQATQQRGEEAGPSLGVEAGTSAADSVRPAIEQQEARRAALEQQSSAPPPVNGVSEAGVDSSSVAHAAVDMCIQGTTATG